MLRIIIFSALITFVSFGQRAHADAGDESWHQVFEFQTRMAAQGSSNAQFTLGEMYENGRGVEKNYDTAIEWYTKAKLSGHENAAERIAMIRQSIKQEAKDKKQAAAKRAADKARAQQKAEEQKRAAAAKRKEAEAKRKEEARDKENAAKVRKAAVQKRAVQAKLTPEERAKKIKEAQERAKKIALQNEKKQQQQADAALEKYRRSLSAQAGDDKQQEQSGAKLPEKYMDPFE